MTNTYTSAPQTRLGLNHVNLVVADMDASGSFYRAVFGMRETHEAKGIRFFQTPGAGDCLALEPAGGDVDRLSGKTRTPGDSAGVDHIGFRVIDLEETLKAVEAAGGQVVFRNTSPTGDPVAFVTDPDGYLLQIDG
jgi:catechol 2,3-dioxygenase-like lactoylglutathione lyase family enzyme